MAAALALAERGLGRTGTNPSVGCIIVNNGFIVGRGWTQSGGRPHAEAMALAQAGKAAKDATVYVTLEPCAHESSRGPACTDVLIRAHPKAVVSAVEDPDTRTLGQGHLRLRDAGIDVLSGVMASQALRVLAGFRSRVERGRPYVTLKLATSLDGAIALADGTSRWITGDASRAHAHLERSRCDAILVGAGTVKADAPMLTVRLPGLSQWNPRRIMLGGGEAPDGWETIALPNDIANLCCNSILVEGGAMTAASFLKAGLVDRLMLYRAPILIGGGKPSIADFGVTDLESAHGQWGLVDSRRLGNDRLEVYEKTETE